MDETLASTSQNQPSTPLVIALSHMRLAASYRKNPCYPGTNVIQFARCHETLLGQGYGTTWAQDELVYLCSTRNASVSESRGTVTT
eukprot:2369310-Amphidinium_carterae.1